MAEDDNHFPTVKVGRWTIEQYLSEDTTNDRTRYRIFLQGIRRPGDPLIGNLHDVDVAELLRALRALAVLEGDK